jgi:hypothetical protein
MQLPILNFELLEFLNALTKCNSHEFLLIFRNMYTIDFNLGDIFSSPFLLFWGFDVQYEMSIIFIIETKYLQFMTVLSCVFF